MATAHIFIYSDIGTGPGEVSINNVKAQLDKDATDYIVHIISRGGDVFEGYGIYNILKNTGKPIVTHVEGLCASIATLIAFAGEKIVMNRTSEFMVHNPKISELQGGSSDLRNAADQLDMIKHLLIDVSGRRAARNGKAISKDELWTLYDRQTWLSAQQAQEMGFVDEVVDAIKAVAKLDLNKIRMDNKFDRLLTSFKNLVGLTKIKNEFEETLASGQKVIVMSDDEDWTGKQVVLEDGSPLPAGDHTLQSGKTISVDEQGVITQVQEGAAPADQQNDEDMDNKIKELENQLAEAKKAKETAEAAAAAAQKDAATATAKAAKFENRVETIEKQFLKLQEDLGKTVGDKSDDPKGPVIKNLNPPKRDPMGEDALKFYRQRNIIRHEEA